MQLRSDLAVHIREVAARSRMMSICQVTFVHHDMNESSSSPPSLHSDMQQGWGKRETVTSVCLPGGEGAGYVQSVGEGVTKYMPGDRVYIAGSKTGTNPKP